MNKPLLELIIPHKDEPWETGKPLFDMIAYQRCADFSSVAVTVVQAGKENGLPWAELLRGYPFRTRIITLESGSIAEAKNAAVAKARADWICFLGWNGMFADVCALSMMTEHLPTNDFDVIWGKYITEQRWGGGDLYLQKMDNENFYNTDCKMYRKDFLTEHKIRFDSRLENYSDYIFNGLLLTETTANRIVHLTTPFYVYISKNVDKEPGEAKREYDAQLKDRFRRDLMMSDMFRLRGNNFESDKKLAYLICSEYFRVYDVDDGEFYQKPSDEFMRFYRKNRNVLDRISPLEVEAIKDEAETEVMAMIQHFYNQHKMEYYLVNDTLSFDEWLAKTDALMDRMDASENERETEQAGSEKAGQAGRERELKPVLLPNNPYVLGEGRYVEGVDEPAELAEPEEQEETDKITDADVKMPDGQGKITGKDAETVSNESATGHREPRVAVYCGTYNTYLDILTSAKSLLWHTKMDKIYFLIEDDVFPYELPDNDIIECINVKNQTWFPESGPNYGNAWSYMCMMRAVFTKLIPYDKVLSLDIDVVIQEDIGCLWDIDLTDYYLAGVEEPQRKKQSSDPLYINFGVVMMNLANLRRDGLDDRIIAALNKNKFLCPEQDAFNQFCAHRIYRLSNDYNATIHSHITGDAEKERIVHFAGIRFWRHFGPVKEYGNRPWELVMERQGELM